MSDRIPILDRWPPVHAALLVAAGAWSVAARDIHPVLILGVASFGFLLLRARNHRQPSDTLFTPANSITALRLAAVVGLAETAVLAASSAFEVYLAAGGLVILLMDRIDGWLARRNKTSSSLGSLFDQEVDAFFLLVLCLIAALSDRLGPWILLPGFLRYIFSLLLATWPRPVQVPKSSLRARTLFVVMMLAMLTTLLPLPALYVPAAAGGTLLLTTSFTADIWYVTSGKTLRTSLARVLLKISRLLSAE